VAFSHLADGDTVLVDANGGTPYVEGNCVITNSNLTISGVNGRPILDATGVAINKAIWIVDGHNDVIDNFEFRNSGPAGSRRSSSNAEAIRAEEGIGTAAGGDMTVQRCYIHDNGTGVLTDSADGTNNWFSTSNYFTFQYDEFSSTDPTIRKPTIFMLEMIAMTIPCLPLNIPGRMIPTAASY